MKRSGSILATAPEGGGGEFTGKHQDNATASVWKSFLMVLLFPVLMNGAATGNYARASQEESLSKLIEGAKAEGKLTWYTSAILPDATRVIKRFEEKYPFIKVDAYRGNSVTLTNKLMNEVRAQKHIVDVLNIVAFKASQLNKEHIYSSYFSPESRTFPETLKDRDGYWAGTNIVPYLMAYNTKLLSRKDVPATFEGLLNPRWKGKIGFDTKEIEWFANMLKIMGEDKGMDFFKKFAAQNLNYRRDRALIRDLIIAGEFPIGTAYAHQVEDRKRDGAPLDWVGISPVIAMFSTIGLVAHAPHPHAAKLFIDFNLSQEGQTLIANFGRVPARPDIESETLKGLKGVKIYTSDMSLADKFSVYNKKSIEVFGR